MIHKILKPGGRWINLGPLLYHFADIPKEPSIEPSYDIVRRYYILVSIAILEAIHFA